MTGMNLEWIEKVRARRELYRLLALCLYMPAERFIADLISSNLVDDFRKHFAVLHIKGIENYLKNIESFTRDHQEKDLASIEASCCAEYMRLFVGPGPVPCPPYESVYRADVPAERRGLLMGDAAAAVQKKYGKAGLKIAPDYTDLPDHISTELEFMYFLCGEELAAWEYGDYEKGRKYRIMQQNFLAEHLNVWVSSFSKAVEKATNNKLYLSIVSLCSTYISQDSEVIESCGKQRKANGCM